MVSAGRPGIRMWHFLDTINMMNVKLCMILALIKLYPITPTTVTLIVFQGHKRVKQF